MAEFPAIPLETRKAQAQASDPRVSAWVSANAGSGKTYVLSRRVIRLLLDHVEPARILCLTFTKAAAAEMSNRIFETLGRWVVLDEPALAAELAGMLGRPASPGETSHARTLFALALDTPGGLKIQTIHAFCEALLHQFPLEANVPGHFEVVDELREAELVAEARRQTLTAIERGEPASATLAEAFAGLVEHASDAAIDKALVELIALREPFSQWVGGDLQAAMLPLWQRFGLLRELDEAAFLASMLAEDRLDDDDLARLADQARHAGGATNLGFAAAAEAVLKASEPRQRFRLRNRMLLTQKGTARRSPVTAAVAKALPDQCEKLQADGQGAERQISRLSIFRQLKASEKLFFFADKMLARYDSLKRAGGLVDFGDLIARAGNLLNRSDVREWVRYKLDRGIDHVLIDEAQDTSPEQWDIVDAIVAEFHAGETAARANRTVFAVGDEKQSIYSFQGADPARFALQAREIEARARHSAKPFAQVRLNLSFRSSPDILGAVDRVFSLPENFRGLGAQGSGTVHEAIRARDPGEVRIWPIEAKAKETERTDWLAPIDAEQPGDPAVRLARRIAGTIRGWIDRGEKLPGRDRAIRHGDILILVRRRDRFMTAVIRELKEKGLGIAGADRLKLTEHIAIEDLTALGRAMVLPEDDLSLAAVLKSPLFGLDEDELTAICHGRNGTALYDHLDQIGKCDPPVAARARTIKQRLERMRQVAAHSSVFDFYAHVLGREGGRKAFLARLGSEAQDVLDAFEHAALAHDRQGGAGLESFLAKLDRASPEIKREVDVRRDEIRVLTVHAAKGLEAPVVFLVDPCSPAYIRTHAPSVIDLPDESNGGTAYLWVTEPKTAGADIQARFDTIAASAEEEYRRLLYVGMTRAADRLIVCGYRGVLEPQEDHWHKMVERALKPQAREIRESDDGLADLVWQNPDHPVRRKMRERPLAKTAETDAGGEPDIPDWLSEDAGREPAVARPLNPSAAMTLKGKAMPEDPDLLPETAGEPGLSPEQRREAMRRGTAIHRLLQILPDVEPGEREAVGKAWLDRHHPEWDHAARHRAFQEAADLIADPRYRPLFGPGSRPEVGVAGNIRLGGRDILVSGQIDRLAVLDDEIIIADFKTNRVVSEDPATIEEGYRLQLALYRALLAEIYPARSIRCLLVWTQSGTTTEIDEAELRRLIEDITPPRKALP